VAELLFGRFWACSNVISRCTHPEEANWLDSIRGAALVIGGVALIPSIGQRKFDAIQLIKILFFTY
jgi:hypothetical protein